MKRVSLTLAAVLVAHASTSGCSSHAEGLEPVTCPDFASFHFVSSVLERHCGSIDCHGRLERPLRIFGQFGTRKPLTPSELAAHPEIDPSQYYPGGAQATTPDELLDNYRSVCGLEPAIISLVALHEERVDALTIVRKPRYEEKHKGGQIWATGSDGDLCLTSWLDPRSRSTGAIQEDACTRGATEGD
jgi:hypothetical protein